MKTNVTIGLLGNPNCGKTTLFNALTGSKQRVGNWPGVTVERKSGEYRLEEQRVEVVDLPGTYSLDVVDRDISLDERVARDYVQAGEADLIINIVDASNLERNLYLTTQLVEMGTPLLLVLNMTDVAEAKGMQVNAAELSKQLGCPVVPVVASTGTGIVALKTAIGKAADEQPRATAQVSYAEPLGCCIDSLTETIQKTTPTTQTSHRWLAVRALEGDDLARQTIGESLTRQAIQAAEQFNGDLDILIADARYSLANRIANASVKNSGEVTRDLTDRIDRVVLNRALGIPIFLFMMYLMFMFTINIGGAFIDFFDQFTGALLVDGFAELLGSLGSPEWLTVLLAKVSAAASRPWPPSSR